MRTQDDHLPGCFGNPPAALHASAPRSYLNRQAPSARCFTSPNRPLVVGVFCLLLASSVHNAAAVVVTFGDRYIEDAIRWTIQKPTGPILDTDLIGVGLTNLYIMPAVTPQNLAGLEYCTDLEEIRFDGGLGWIETVAPLAGLTKLRVLQMIPCYECFYPGSPGSDFNLLSNLVNLQELRLEAIPLNNDLTWMANFTQLRELLLGWCGILALPVLPYFSLCIPHELVSGFVQGVDFEFEEFIVSKAIGLVL